MFGYSVEFQINYDNLLLFWLVGQQRNQQRRMETQPQIFGNCSEIEHRKGLTSDRLLTEN